MSVSLDDILAALAADNRDRIQERSDELLRIFDNEDEYDYDFEDEPTLEELLELDKE